VPKSWKEGGKASILVIADISPAPTCRQLAPGLGKITASAITVIDPNNTWPPTATREKRYTLIFRYFVL